MENYIPNGMFKPWMTRSRKDVTAGSQLLNISQPLELDRVNEFNDKVGQIDLPVNRIQNEHDGGQYYATIRNKKSNWLCWHWIIDGNIPTLHWLMKNR